VIGLPSAWTARASDLGYGAGWQVVRALPEPAARIIFERAGDLATRRDGKSVQQLRRNLSRVRPDADEVELDRLVKAGMRSYARYWMETFRLPAMDIADLMSRTNMQGFEHVQAGLAKGNGVVVGLPHSGNWDVAGLWLVQHGIPFTTVAERLKPESLYDRFVAYRESLGMEVLPLTGGPRAPMDVLVERLAANGVVCLVAERDLSQAGVEVDFFGEKTRMPPGPALLAARTGADLLPVHLHYSPNGWEQWVGAPIDLGTGRLREKVIRATQAMADQFAARIEQYPTDWHMLQRLWLADLDPARLRPAAVHPAAEHPVAGQSVAGQSAIDGG
jgi:lauroyl/myristoyl acyltransferase